MENTPRPAIGRYRATTFDSPLPYFGMAQSAIEDECEETIALIVTGEQSGQIACLFATAPDLLAACRKLLNDWGNRNLTETEQRIAQLVAFIDEDMSSTI